MIYDFSPEIIKNIHVSGYRRSKLGNGEIYGGAWRCLVIH